MHFVYGAEHSVGATGRGHTIGIYVFCHTKTPYIHGFLFIYAQLEMK